MILICKRDIFNSKSKFNGKELNEICKTKIINEII
jgi:hypothetical protein